MSTEFKMPSDEEMPAALAKLMRCETWCTQNNFGVVTESWGRMWGSPGKFDGWSIKKRDWSPMTDRNHSRLAVEDCERLALQYEYIEELVKEVMPNRVSGGGMTGGPYVTLETFTLALATPTQESRAAYRTLWNHHNKETK